MHSGCWLNTQAVHGRTRSGIEVLLLQHHMRHAAKSLMRMDIILLLYHVTE
jgi:hypothetical protein